MRHFLVLLLGVFIGAQSWVFCLEGEEYGYKYFRTYRANDYSNSPQNWAIVQNRQGIIYVANQGGLLEFDGIAWHSYEIPNQSVNSLAIDDNGILFIGGINEFGFMTPDIRGMPCYNSLIRLLKDNERDFGQIWAIHVTKEGVYFQSKTYLFRWYEGKLSVWNPEPKFQFNASFICRGIFYVHSRDFGLMQMENETLQILHGFDSIKGEKIYLMVPYNKQKLLVGTRSKGLFLFDGRKLESFSTEADAYLNQKQLYHGIALKFSPGQFALATRQGGVAIIDTDGKLKAIYNTNNLLPDRGVNYIHEDFQGNLWLALNRGICNIEYNSTFFTFDERSGLPGMVLSSEKHNNTLYVGTYNGLFSLAPDGKFHNVQSIESPNWSLLSTGKSLLVATTHGLLQVGEKTKEKISEDSTYVLVKSQKEPRRVWAGTGNGLVSLFLEKDRWGLEHKFTEIKNGIWTIVEDENGSLWLGIPPKESIKIDFPSPSTITNPVIQRFGKEQGLPDQEIRVFWAAGYIMFATETGLFRFDEQTSKFIPDPTLGPDYTNGTNNVFCLAEDKGKKIWFHSMLRNIEAIPGPANTFTLNKKPFLRLPREQTNAIFPDPDNNKIWFATNDGLILYDKTIKKNYDLNFTAIIRKVTINGELIFGGDKSGQPQSTFSYKDKNLRFQFAAPFFEGESETRFRTFLEGYEKQWSEWTPEPQKEFTNLNSGQYTFHVQAKNVYENLSSEAVFQFKVLLPFYKTWWAFLVYAILSFFMVFLLIKWRSGKLEREKLILDRTVKERTQEIKEKNRQLEDQSIKLQEMDQIKSRFFANISHEFRTPLTLIMGPLQQMIAACRDNEQEEKRKLNMMLRNAQRLLRLINQLLELSKLDSGKMKLQAVKTDIISFLKGIIDSFGVLAYQNQLDLVLQTEGVEEIFLYLDLRKMEDVMANLLVNAFKFTPAGGKITVVVEQKLLQGGAGSPGQLGGGGFLEKSPPGCRRQGLLEIAVCDTGPGIPAGDLPYIFDRFYQAESTYELHQKGTGIGLALAKELVELHHGTIEARSREGEGCTFIVRLPLGRDHLSPDQIVELPLNHTKTQPTTDDITNNEIPLNNHEPENGANESNIILVVEDSADMCDYIRGALEPGYTVVNAKDGREGIEKAQDIIPDLIISDIMMPEKDGYELCRTLKNDVKTSHIPIILLTARAAEENIIQGLESGADDYITKPFNTNILIARIKNLIDIRRQLQKNINREMSLQPVKTSISSIDREFLKDLHEAIQKNLDDEDFNVEKLCKILYMGRTTLYRKVLALTGETPTDFIRSYRLKKGAELLKQNSTTVLEVAMAVGFSNSSYFAKCFKEKFHQLPSEYQTRGK